MKRLFQKPQYDGSKSVSQNTRELFDGVARIVEDMNRERSEKASEIVYSGNISSGTAKVPLETAGYTLFIAVISSVPTLCVHYSGTIAGRGGNNDTETSLSAQLAGEKLTFFASGTLDLLIALQ